MNDINPNRISDLESQCERDRFFFNAVRYSRDENNRKKKDNYSWAARDYKFYPSSLRSLRMCPYNHVHQEVHKAPDFPLNSVYSMELGTAVHTMLQKQALSVPGLLYQRPNFCHMPIVHSMEMEAKMQEAWPEVPVFDPWSWTSGRADLVVNYYGEPVVIDIKTTSHQDVQQEKDRKTGEYSWVFDRWEAKKNSLPSEEHKLQVGIYVTLMNRLKYYDKPITKAGLCYLNLSVKPGDVYAESEHYWEINSDLQAQIEVLLWHLGQERKNYLDKVESSCSYPYCRIHGGKNA